MKMLNLHMHVRYLVALFCALVAFASHAAENKPNDTQYTLTIYSQVTPNAVPRIAFRPTMIGSTLLPEPVPVPGYAMVHEEKSLTIPSARYRFTWPVPASIDPSSVTFSSLTNPDGTYVINQQYQFSLISPSVLLPMMIGKTLEVDAVAAGSASKTVTGTLLQANGDTLVLQDAQGAIHLLSGYHAIRLPTLPDNAKKTPSLEWDIATEKPGPHKVQLRYQVDGISWWTDYQLVYVPGKEQKDTIDLTAWVNILNQSGANYPNATIKLMAGDVQRVGNAMPRPRMMKMEMAAAAAPDMMPEEKSFDDYHLYHMPEAIDLPYGVTQQHMLFVPVKRIPATRGYLYQGQMDNSVVSYLRFKNVKDHRLGIPLPQGRVRISREDPKDHHLELIGEDTMSHTPPESEITLTLGRAFDIKGERKVIATRTKTPDRRVEEEDIEITLRNQTKNPVTVDVRETFHHSGSFKITQHSHDFKVVDTMHAMFTIQVKEESSQTLRYTVHYD